MHVEFGQLKTIRILQLYERLLQQQVINKKALAVEFQVSEKSIQRDIEDLRTYLSEYYQHCQEAEIIYSERLKGYYMKFSDETRLSANDVLVTAKMMLESRAFNREEMTKLLQKWMVQVPLNEQKMVRDILKNELFLYIPVRHEQPLLRKISDLSIAVREHRVVNLRYVRVAEQLPVELLIQPVSVMFADYYFYCIAYVDGSNREYPATFRLDRIQTYALTNERFKVSQKTRFQEGVFRQQVQFMQLGKLWKIKFRFWNTSLESILDRLPNARVTMEKDAAIIEAEVLVPHLSTTTGGVIRGVIICRAQQPDQRQFA